MKSLRQFALGCVLLFMLNAHAQQPSVPDPKIDTMLKDYLASWATTDKAERADRLKKLWATKALHESSFARSVGIKGISDEIDGFQKMFPNAIIKFGTPQRTGKSHLLCAFELRKADGSVIATGFDYFELDDNGRILKVIGFVNS